MEVVVFGISLEHGVILLPAALFVLGPERLPGAARWSAEVLRRARELVSDVERRLETELEPELQELRKPLPDLRTPRAGSSLDALRSHRRAEAAPPTAQPALSSSRPAGPPPIDPDAT
ncbi:Sec-independent protein translocase TatB [Amycolatopsis sp. NBC_01307]|uniref:Sec-independent protein translocase TatB n=1 Tax=Amycolatopsis sp. NBC_01307 TaxID=2903561 RepID=UPI002E0D4416|nr:Sec-independent protein translocase TatB [Amycolatopsis sp. NBC_01307]